ncbi:MAG: 2Fe-2S iron-sulfur cluster binding domain-containing protein, partial [Leptospiraceae bacterium]|nr:2Fe-2S iron-sulfur cluster binding domain-containing protein [Leptospiraceae bacterium]
HVHACGGNARCSTCRVLVSDGLEQCEPRNAKENELAARKGFGDSIRLACQTRVRGPVKLRRLVIDEEDIKEASTQTNTGKEKALAILFSDIRNFTPFTENNLPYDVVHILNRYFTRMGAAIQQHGGYIDKYIGDGLMAIFGIEQDDPLDICMRAVRAARDMLSGLQEVNQYLCNHLEAQFKIGIGIHFGDVIIGELGHPDKRQFTALGDNVNMASRIESSCKKAGAALLISEDMYQIVAGSVRRGRVFEAGLKGKSGRYRLYEILDVPAESSTPEGRSSLDASPGGQSQDESVSVKEGTGNMNAEVLAIRDAAHDTRALLLRHIDGSFHFSPGQWVDVSLPNFEERRVFSIASAPRDDGTFMLATRIRSNSEFKQKLAVLKAGNALKVSKPMGEFTIPEKEARPIVLLAGGIGITPFRSMLEQALLSGDTRSFYLFYSNHTPDSTAFFRELKDWSADAENFHFIPTVTRSGKFEWGGERGRITVPLIKKYLADDMQAAVYYIAGPPEMVTALRSVLLEGGIAESHIIFEEFTGY